MFGRNKLGLTVRLVRPGHCKNPWKVTISSRRPFCVGAGSTSAFILSTPQPHTEQARRSTQIHTWDIGTYAGLVPDEFTFRVTLDSTTKTIRFTTADFTNRRLVLTKAI